MPNAKVSDGNEIYFETHGCRSNPAIFMGPHFYTSRAQGDRSFTDVWIEGMKKDFFLITADYPRGIGRSRNPPGLTFNPDVAVQECECVADAVGVDRFGWVGYSFGGAIGVQLACRTDRVAALAVGGFPPLAAPFQLLVEILTDAAKSRTRPDPSFDASIFWTAVGFYEPLVAWPERQEVGRLAMPRLAFMGDRDSAQGLPGMRSAPLAESLRATEEDLRSLGWQISWLRGHDHASTIRPEVSLPLVQQFFRQALAG